MTSWKTSEIARRLAERDDAEPPEGLLEKIKKDIPAELPSLPRVPEIAERPRPPRRRIWLMAASLAAAVCGGVFGLWMMQSKALKEEEAMQEGARAPEPAAVPAPRPEEKTRAAGAKEKEEAQLKGLGYVSGGQAKQQAQPRQVPAPAAPPPPPKPSVIRRQETLPAQAESAPEPAAGVPGGAVGGVTGTEAGKDERRADKEMMKKTAPAREAASSLDKAQDAKRDRANAGGNEAGRQADLAPPSPAPATDAPPPPAAGFAAPPAHRSAAAGQAPAAAARAEALVGTLSFGGEALSRVNAAVRADGAPNPFAAGDRERLLRLDVPAAGDARVKVDFNPAAVASWRRLGTDRSLAAATARTDTVAAGPASAGPGATVLYAVTLQPDARRSDPVVTLHLGTASRELRVGDLAPSWEAAAPGLRLASLAAELGEVLRGSPSARNVDLDDLLRRARAVAAELAGTSREAGAAELVKLAEEAARRR